MGKKKDKNKEVETKAENEMAGKPAKSGKKRMSPAEKIAELKRRSQSGSDYADILPFTQFNAKNASFGLKLKKDMVVDIALASRLRSEPKYNVQCKEATRFIIDTTTFFMGASGFVPNKKGGLVFEKKSLPDDMDYREIDDFVKSLPPIVDENGNPVKGKYNDQSWKPYAEVEVIALDVPADKDNDFEGGDVYAKLQFKGIIQYHSARALLRNIMKLVEDEDVELDLADGKIAPVVYVSDTEEVNDYYSMVVNIEDLIKAPNFAKAKETSIKLMKALNSDEDTDADEDEPVSKKKNKKKKKK